ncbi:MAG TPA: hypothetical protein VKB09_02725 [Thermomicrobiales bacterium]|nr:hypothetical protein [Thermomicrobiales bacterium]
MTVAWQRHRLSALGLSFEVDSTRSLDTVPLDDGAILTQRFADEAAVFVRYGPDQTLDRFLAGLGDLLTTATTLADEPVQIAGHPARRLTVSLQRRGKQIPGRPTYRPSRIEVTGFSVRDIPVLVGYRLPEGSSDDIRAAVERFAGSVDTTDVTSPEA